MNYRPAVMAALLLAAVSKGVAEPSKKAAPPPPHPAPSVHMVPPLEYDYPYQGKLTITRVKTVAELQAACNVNKWALGCAFAYDTHCHIVLVPDDMIRKWGWTPELMMRHEIGHCNGWPGDHPGERPYWARPGKPPTNAPELPVVDTRMRLPEVHCPSGQVTEPCR